MPTYDYACTSCEHAFEVFQAFTDDALTECPQCQGRLRKVFGSVGVVFKGSGFYRTDSRAGAVPAGTSSSTDSGKGATSDGGASAGGPPSGTSSGSSSTSGSSSSSGSSGSSSTAGSSGSSGSSGSGSSTGSSSAA